MHIDGIQAWIDSVDPSSQSTVPNEKITPFATANRRRLSDHSMESPSKRKCREQPEAEAPFDPDKTPQSSTSHSANSIFDQPPPPFHVTASTIDSFPRVLAARPHFSKSASSTSQRSPSPSKQYKKRSDLHRLNRPIRFSLEPDLKAALPPDAHNLYKALHDVQWGYDILPHALKDREGFEIPDAHRSMWQSPDPSVDDDTVKGLLERHACFQDIVSRTKQSADRGRSEAAWNSHVHYQVLHMLAETTSIIAEDITSARIVSRFRPCVVAVDEEDASVSSTSSNTSASRGHTAKSVHKMVDFALALEPDPQLANIIERFTKLSVDGTVNQTAYFSLRNRPATVFIETKTTSGNLETSGVQLAVWIAAWHESLRSIMTRGGIDERIITVPLIQVLEGTWTVMFAVDGGDELKIVYGGQVMIGNSNSLMGMYQLQAAFKAITEWMEGSFNVWITRVLTTALA
ncbi:methyltransferase type 11 [Fusarium coicis]|nr:methyltransferase type 11 [Fusarium coicis]